MQIVKAGKNQCCYGGRFKLSESKLRFGNMASISITFFKIHRLMLLVCTKKKRKVYTFFKNPMNTGEDLNRLVELISRVATGQSLSRQ